MMPMYRYMDSHPEQRHQTCSLPQYPYSMYQPNPPVSYLPWPYGGNFGYPNPAPCYSCCNHSHGPSYNGFRPSYPQTPMPSPVHCAGGCPAPYHEAYPVQYVPPHYSRELPRYDYDKKRPGNSHCCECPNHSHQNKGVKIEEQEASDVVEKAPNQMINYPYPVVWIPPEYMKGEEQRKISGPKIVEQKNNPVDERPPPVSLKSQEGDQLRGFLPLDMNNIGSLMQGGNGERVKDQRSDDRKNEFPFPIFWMPSYGAGKKDNDMGASQDKQNGEPMKQFPFPFFWFPNKQKGVGMKEEEENEESRKVDANARIVPTKHTDSSDNGTRVHEAKSAEPGVVKGKGKGGNQKVIPVKQVDLPKKEDNSEGTKRKAREVSVKHVDDCLANKPSGSSAQSQSSSPKKSSKLPPVCLRVDPLPSKKKNGGRSSRSPSPPSHKKVQKETLVETSKASASSGMPENSQQNQQPHDCISNNTKEVQPCKEVKVIEVVDKGTSENKDSMHTSHIGVKSGDPTAQNMDETKKTSGSAEESLFEKKRLDVEAAVLIQSAYRGYMVRRWEPMKKLKQIAEIREQVADIRNKITSLETSDLKQNDKQRVVIGETIMRLLLRLDTIQGLLPSLRDTRRSLARELVLLQEKLDDIRSKKSQDTAQEVSAVKTVDGLSSNGNDSACMSEHQIEEAAKVGEEFPAGVSDNTHVATECFQGEVTQAMHSVLGMDVDVPVVSEHKEPDTASENAHHELPVASDLNSEGLVSGNQGPTIESTDNIADGQLSVQQAVVVDVDNGATQLEQCGEVPFLAEGKLDHSVVSTASVATTSTELPQEAVNTEPAAAEPEHIEAFDMIKDELEHGGEVGMNMSADVSSPIATVDASEKEVNMHELAALQLSTTDEDSGEASELNKHEEVHIVMDNDVSECVVEEKVAEPQEEETVGKLMNVGGEVDEDDTGDTVDVVHHHQNEASVDGPLPAVSQTVVSQPSSSAVETSTYDMVHENELSASIDVGDACLSTLVDAEMPGEVEIEESMEGYKDLQAVTVEEVAPMKENRAESNNEQADDKSAKEDILIEKSEPLPPSPTEVPSGNGSASYEEGPGKLIEENEKLREMMQKLMVAGNEQLQVISDLTGKVKDLEKKLAKKKKLRTRRSRCATYRSSCVKPLSNHLKERADVAK